MREKHYFNQERNFWINIQQDDVLAVKNLKEEYGISDEMLTYSLDKNERARVEYDSFDEALLLVSNVPHQQKVDNHYETSPIAFILKEDGLFTFTTPNTEYVIRLIRSLLERMPDMSVYSLLFHTLFLISDSFFPLIEEVNSERQRLNLKLREKNNKQESTATFRFRDRFGLLSYRNKTKCSTFGTNQGISHLSQVVRKGKGRVGRCTDRSTTSS